MRNKIIENFEQSAFGAEKLHPSFRPGDSVRVHYKIEESTKNSKEGAKKKYRIQVFEGVCIRRRNKNGLANATFTVRKMGANSIGVERVFPVNSSHIDKIDLISGGSVHQSRLYYLRGLSGKAARIKSRRLPADTVLTSVERNKSAK